MSKASPRSTRGSWILVGVLLAPAVVVPLLIPIYDRTDPTLFGFPFYFWFQFALIPMAAVLTVSAYYVAKNAERHDRDRRRAARDPGPLGNDQAGPR
jgi:uncharacterized membrane protein